MEEENQPKKSLIQDLWDRRLFQYLGTYLGVSFGLIQFAEFLESRFELGPNLVEKVFLFLLIMLPAVALFIYNHGRKGHDEWKPIEKYFIPTSLVAALGISLFMFNNAEKEIEKVSITNTEGDTITRIIPAMGMAKRLVIFPFKYDAQNDSDKWLSWGTSFLLDKDLEQDMRTSSIQPFSLREEYESHNIDFHDDISFSTQLKIAQDNYSDYFITGAINKVDSKLRLVSEVFESNSGRLFISDTVSSDDVFGLVDQVSQNINAQLYTVESGNREEIIDLPAKDLITPNEDVLKSLVDARLILVEGPQHIAQAITQVEEAIGVDPKCGECFSFLSNLYLGANREEDATNAIDNALKFSSALPERQRLNIGYYNYMVKEQVSNAIRLLENWKKLYPRDQYPYFQLISLYRRSLEVDQAKEVAKTAIDNGHRGKVLIDLAQLYIDSEDYELAETYMEEFSNLYPHKAKEKSLLGKIYLEQGKLDDAIRFYQDLSILEPTDPGHIVEIASIQDRLGKFEEAKKLYQQALALGSRPQDSIAVYVEKENHFKRLGQFALLFETLEARENALLRIMPPIGAKVQLINAIWPHKIAVKDYEGFRARFQELKDMLPERASIFQCLEDFFFALGTEDLEKYEATPPECLEIIFQSSGKNFEIIYDAGLKELRGDFKEAALGYENYIDSTGLNDKRLSTALSKLYRKSDQLNKAEQLMERNLKTDPSNPEFLFEYAKIARDQGKAQLAKERLNQVMHIWKDADPEYTLFQEAMELASDLQ